MIAEAYTAQELVDLLKARQGGLTLKQYADEIGISFQLLAQILQGQRSVGNEKVLAYLAPKGKHYLHRDQWLLVPETIRTL